MKKILLLKYCL